MSELKDDNIVLNDPMASMIDDPAVTDKWREIDNDQAHYKEFDDIVDFVRNSINDTVAKFMYKEFDLEKQKIECAKECGCFIIQKNFVTGNSNDANKSLTYTASEYESLDEAIKTKCSPVIPGDMVWCDRAFFDYGQHFGVYLGRINSDKYGYILEVDAVLELGSKSTGQMVVSLGSIICSTSPGVLRCYKNLNEFTFMKSLDKIGKSDREHGNFQQDNSDLNLDYGSFTTKSGVVKYTKDQRNNCGVVFRGSKDLNSIDGNFIYNNLKKGLECFKKKIFYYNGLNSNCENFAQYVTTGRFITPQVFATRADVCVSSIKVITVGAAAVIAAPVVGVGALTAFLFGTTLAATTSAQRIIRSHFGGNGSNKIIYPEIFILFKMINDDPETFNKMYSYLTKDIESINKAKTANLYKSLILSLDVSDKSCESSTQIDSYRKIFIVKILLSLHKKFTETNSGNETDNSLLNSILSKINELGINIDGQFLNRLDVENPKYKTLIEFIIESVNATTDKTLLEYDPAGGDLMIDTVNGEMTLYKANKFEELSETFIGELLANHGGRRRYKHKKTKKINKKYKKRNMKTKRNKSKRYRRR
jgi:hypothetical protein